MNWYRNPPSVWRYSACDNKDCPEFAAVKARVPGAAQKVVPTWQNGKTTLCETCYEEKALVEARP